MMHKKLLTLALALTLVSSITQALTVTYPTKRILKKADHIASLATTVTLMSAFIADKYNHGLADSILLAPYGIVLTAQSIINGMALKHDRSVAAMLKFLLPVGTFAGWIAFIKADNNADLEDMGFWMLVGGIAGNGVKNIWDIYSLAKHDQSESIQHDV